MTSSLHLRGMAYALVGVEATPSCRHAVDSASIHQTMTCRGGRHPLDSQPRQGNTATWDHTPWQAAVFSLPGSSPDPDRGLCCCPSHLHAITHQHTHVVKVLEAVVQDGFRSPSTLGCDMESAGKQGGCIPCRGGNSPVSGSCVPPCSRRKKHACRTAPPAPLLLGAGCFLAL
jgi:hypothetical protein